jgi:sugar O-acyltransferase (sialic acid O-acetyltransferase NeuD family)
MSKKVILIGYSGHSYVVYDLFTSMGISVTGYCDREQKTVNPYSLSYLGMETDSLVLSGLKKNPCFVSVGDNHLREKASLFLEKAGCEILNAVHSSAIVSPSVKLGKGIMISVNTIINAQCVIQDGVICNTAAVIEHECVVGKYSHIGPSAVLCGGVHIGDKTLIGAGVVIKPCVSIGNNVIVGAGCVVVKDIPDNSTVVGNPQRLIRH